VSSIGIDMNETAPMMLRGIRGATTATGNTADAILDATEELLAEIVRANGFELEYVASTLFTVTPDLSAAFPAAAARRMGWHYVPLLNFTEIAVPNGLARCIRVMIHLNTRVAQADIQHIYLREAHVLRPDLTHSPESATEQKHS
jgi:chorismate mutase